MEVKVIDRDCSSYHWSGHYLMAEVYGKIQTMIPYYSIFQHIDDIKSLVAEDGHSLLDDIEKYWDVESCLHYIAHEDVFKIMHYLCKRDRMIMECVVRCAGEEFQNKTMKDLYPEGKKGSNWVVYTNQVYRVKRNDLISLDGTETIDPHKNVPVGEGVEMGMVVFPEELRNVPDEERMNFLRAYQAELNKKQ